MLLFSKPFKVACKIQHTTLLGIPDSKKTAGVEVEAQNIELPRGELCTAWKPLAQMDISFESALTVAHQDHLLARWRVRKGNQGYHLALEALVIPMTAKPLGSMATNARALMMSLGAPVIVLWASPHMIQWTQVYNLPPGPPNPQINSLFSLSAPP